MNSGVSLMSAFVIRCSFWPADIVNYFQNKLEKGPLLLMKGDSWVKTGDI